jgi:diphosphomevalonate decarboxylase
VAARRNSASVATFEAPPNIALIKYWGVRNAELGLPYNSSLSVTLDRFRSRTTVRFDPSLDRDRFALNRSPQSGAPLAAVSAMLDLVRSASRRNERAWVTSSNNFPTASGLASSASGFAALAGASAAAAGLSWSPQRLSQLARLGSGSACRSLFGGFVEWRAGTRDDGGDCYARPLFGPDHWPGLLDLVAILADARTKTVRSSVAMQRSVATSPGFFRRQEELPGRIRSMVRAIRRRDAPELFGLMIEECDSFRSVCEGTRPSLDYLTKTSRRILTAVRELNRVRGESVVGYTHDAGAHLHLFLQEETVPELRRALRPIPGIRSKLLLRPGPGARMMRPG